MTDRKSSLVTKNLAIRSGGGIFKAVNGLNMSMDGFFHGWEGMKIFHDDLNLYPDLDNQPNCLS